MRTLVVSDLHLGTRCGVLARPAALEAFTARLAGADRLVLLGDTIELRQGPARDALAAAEPVLRAIGEAVGDSGEVVLAPGNHDHALAAGWLDWRGRREAPPALELEQRIPPSQASWIAKRMAGWLAPAAVEVAYPGVWLRDDVYAHHGHYLDVHATLPTFERLSAGAMGLLTGTVGDPATIEEYERQLTPLYAWTHAVAQRHLGGRRSPGDDGMALRVFKQLQREAGRKVPWRSRALAGAFPLAVLAVNRAGLGPVRADVSGAGMRRSALCGIGEVTRRLDVRAAHMVFGHSHRAGPLPGDDPGEWRTPGGAQLHNPGSWTYETSFMGSEPSSANPYWPGGIVVVEDEGPPRLERLLADAGAEVLSAPPA